MRSFEFVKEDPRELQTAITTLVKKTKDEALLNRVYNALRSSDVTQRISAALSKDGDSEKFLDTLTSVVLNTEGTVDEKIAFADNYSKGYIKIRSLFSKKKVGYDDFIVPGFPQKVFDALIPVIKQGVGPGELALSIMSPAIRFTGQETGGGDLQVKGVGFVELKTEQSSGGRWINARKANMDLSAIKNALEKYSEPLGARVSVPAWLQIRQQINNKGTVNRLSKLIANATFNQVENSIYAAALAAGDAQQIKTAVLSVGFENYKAYSNFDGLLIMSVPQRTAQYFTTIEELLPNIRSDSPYILAPESEMMPRVRIGV